MCRPMRKHSGRSLVLAFFAALSSGAFCLGNDGTVSPESLLAQARKLQDVWSDGTPAVKVRTEISILDAKGKTIPGQYVVTWISPSHWRESSKSQTTSAFACTIQKASGIKSEPISDEEFQIPAGWKQVKESSFR